jgi:hypothetical protein
MTVSRNIFQYKYAIMNLPVPPAIVPTDNMSNYDTYVLAYYLNLLVAGIIPPASLAGLNQEITQLAFKAANHADLLLLSKEATQLAFKAANHTDILAVITALNSFAAANHTDLTGGGSNLIANIAAIATLDTDIKQSLRNIRVFSTDVGLTVTSFVNATAAGLAGAVTLFIILGGITISNISYVYATGSPTPFTAFVTSKATV